LAACAAQVQADRYRKHFTAYQHAWLLLFHGLSGSASLRQSYAAFTGYAGLRALSGLAVSADPEDERLGVSFSQFADSHTTRPAGFLGGLLPGLCRRVRAHGPDPTQAIPLDLEVLDSTFLRLSLKLAPQLPPMRRPDRAGVRLHTRYVPALDLPAHVLVRDLRTNDATGLDQAILDDPAQLASLRGQTLIKDLGSYSHARFARLRAAGVHFVSRRHPQACVQVEADLPVQAPLPDLDGGRIAVTADQRITLGSAHNRAGAVLSGLRLVTATVTPTLKAARRGAQPLVYQVLTDRWDLEAAEVIQCYLWRWLIETFFRWLKSVVRLHRWLGYSQNAVELTVWLALVVHLLTLLAVRALGRCRRSPAFLAALRTALTQLAAGGMPPPDDLATQLPLPDPALGPAPT
jgi:hypothetical protein